MTKRYVEVNEHFPTVRELAIRSAILGLRPSDLIGANPKLQDITESQIATWRRALEVAEESK